MSHSITKQNAGIISLQKLVQDDVPSFEQGAITPDLINAVVNVVLEAKDANTAFAGLQAYREANIPWYEKGVISDDILLKITDTVLAATVNVA